MGNQVNLLSSAGKALLRGGSNAMLMGPSMNRSGKEQRGWCFVMTLAVLLEVAPNGMITVLIP